MAFLSEAAKAALTGAIKAVEARSSAELVITVRAHSGSYLHADLIAAIVVGVATLAALLYLPVDFGLHSFVMPHEQVAAIIEAEELGTRDAAGGVLRRSVGAEAIITRTDYECRRADGRQRIRAKVFA